MSRQAHGYFLTSFGEDLVPRDLDIETPGDDEVIIEVHGCGMCHTDLGYASGSVKPNHALPLVLGHEVMGVVVEAGSSAAELLGKSVLVPAVLPCGDCGFCRDGYSNACLGQKMPGNDINGGFASHVLAPYGPLVELGEVPKDFDARALGVVADAVSTAYQAILRAELGEGDIAYVIGAGGVGGFVTQIAAAMGAHVVACDISAERLESIKRYGAEKTCNVTGKSARDVRKELHGHARELGIPSYRYRIFECSGTPQGQLQAYTLLGRAATLLFVGYTFKKVEVRLSNIMAFDARVHGSWGCPPEAYPACIEMVFNGQVKLDPFIDYAPMTTVNAQLQAMADHRLNKRIVLDPR